MSSATTKTTKPGFPLVDDLVDAGKSAWWLILLRGIFAILFGVLAIIFPDSTLVALAVFFAFYAIFDGVATIVQAVRVRKLVRRWGWLLAQGIFTVLAGIVAAIFPVLAGLFGALVVVYLISFWSVFVGILGFRAAHALAAGGNKTWAYIAAALSVLFGIALAVLGIISPIGAIWSLVVAIGVFAIVAGVLLIGLAISVRSTAKDVRSTAKDVLGDAA